MATAIRLTRIGGKGRPFYRIVVMDSKKKRDGRYIELIGTYDPAKKQDKVVLKAERAKYWLSQGAQPSQTVRSVFKEKGLLSQGR